MNCARSPFGLKTRFEHQSAVTLSGGRSVACTGGCRTSDSATGGVCSWSEQASNGAALRPTIHSLSGMPSLFQTSVAPSNRACRLGPHLPSSSQYGEVLHPDNPKLNEPKPATKVNNS